MRPARRVFLKRVIPAIAMMAIVQGNIVRDLDWRIRNFIYECGTSAGCPSFRSGGYAVGLGGPFLGEDASSRWWNFA